MRIHLRMTLLPLALLAASGCASVGASGDDAVDDQAQAMQASGATADGRRPPPAHGPAALLSVALHELDLSAPQRSEIQHALDTLAPPKGPPAEIRALVAAVRAGSVDAATLDDSAGERHMAEHRAALVAALQTLHRTLSSEQRVALVAALDANPAADGPPDGPPPGPPPDGPPPDGAPPDGPPPGPPPAGGPPPGPPPGGPGGPPRHGAHGPHDPIQHLLAGIALSDEQRNGITAALESAGLQPPAPPSAEQMKTHHEAMRNQRRALLDAFASDSFDADALLPNGPPADAPKPPELGRVLAVVVPLLDANQRNSLADRLERGPQPPPPPRD